ncbi:MAG: hypothetical protein MUF45_01405 [Spirosomaceae bacterium]|jgi:hypothetical protein|nr:hypothetical protein [Spirosomataceae bacterium]
MEESQTSSPKFVFQEVYYSLGDITPSEIKEFFEKKSNPIVLIPFSNNIIELLDKMFPVLKIKKQLGKRFNTINKLAISEEKFNTLNIILNKISLSTHQIELALIVLFGMKSKTEPRFQNSGKTSKIRSQLSNLRCLLQEMVDEELGIEEIQEDDSSDSISVMVTNSYPKYLIKKISLELNDEKGGIKKVKIDIFDKYENISLREKVKLSLFFNESFDNMLDTLDIEPRYVKENTNHQFCQQFFTFINTKTAFSTAKGISEREILNFFTDIYELTGHKFPKTSDKVEMVEKWLKPSRK